MLYKQTTQIPNHIFDVHLASLTESELKLFLVIARQTLGWVDRKTGLRKTRDRIFNSQLQSKTGFKRRIISEAIKSLIFKKLITVTDEAGIVLCHPAQRRGKTRLYYGIALAQHTAQTCASESTNNVHDSAHNKTNFIKPIQVKGKFEFSGHIQELIVQAPYLK